MNSYITIAILKARPGKRDQLQEALLKLIDPTRKEAGCIEYMLFENKNEKGIFYMREAFMDKTAFDEHLASTHFQNFAKQADELLTEPVQLIELERASH